MLRHTRCILDLEVLRALRQCHGATPVAPTPASQPPPQRPAKRCGPPAADGMKTSNADRNFATELRHAYLRHAGKAWGDGHYTKTRAMRRGMMTLFNQRRREGVVGPRSYEVVCAFFSQLGMLKRVQETLRLASEDGIHATPEMMTALLVCHAKGGDIVGVVRTFRWMARQRVPLTPKIVMPLLSVLVKAAEAAAAFKVGAVLLRKLGASGDIYSQLMGACEVSADARVVLQEMRDRNIEVEGVHYTAAISAGIRRREVEPAMQALHMAQEAGAVDTPLYAAVVTILRRAGDLHGVRAITSLALRKAEPTTVLFYQAVSAHVDHGDVSGARLSFLAANGWKLAESLKVMSRMTLAMGLRGNVKDVLRAFDARPLGKYTRMGLIYFSWALVSCLLKLHPAPRAVFMKCLVRDHVSNDMALQLLAYHSFRLRGYGVAALTRHVIHYMNTRRVGKGGHTPIAAGTLRYVAMAAALRVRHLLRTGEAARADALGRAVFDLFTYLVDCESPSAAAVVLPPLVAVCAQLGKVAALLSRVRRLCEEEFWPSAPDGSLRALREAFVLCDDTATARKLTDAVEAGAAQRLWYTVQGAGDYVRLAAADLAVDQTANEARYGGAAAPLNVPPTQITSIDGLLAALPEIAPRTSQQGDFAGGQTSLAGAYRSEASIKDLYAPLALSDKDEGGCLT